MPCPHQPPRRRPRPRLRCPGARDPEIDVLVAVRLVVLVLEPLESSLGGFLLPPLGNLVVVVRRVVRRVRILGGLVLVALLLLLLLPLRLGGVVAVEKTSEGSTSSSVSAANSAVPGAVAARSAYASSSRRFAMVDDLPPLARFGFFCNHLSRNDARVMSAKGSPEYSTLVPYSNDRAIAATDG